MINDSLAFAGPGVWEWLIIILVAGVPVLLIVLFVRFILRNKRENVRLHLELGKLADELEQARKQAQDEQKDKSPPQSG